MELLEPWLLQVVVVVLVVVESLQIYFLRLEPADLGYRCMYL